MLEKLKCEWCNEEITEEQSKENNGCCCTECMLMIGEMESMKSAGR